ncbi:MAG: copper homeostasis protein CutC [Winogradskyella sp.]|uniref:copper homeostasis protein CutC n=1 Tax=Winogradskyella sp. TaxID=1883156 RepID=UPI0017D29FC5|nr:copper homeostasis protein CutC [Winogradskyella sp.]MBT8244957.1 copper homeostasis protein CutC [Winogradskyella sp.]NNK22201.1 copper homeostasis protein CutC [Winogradskyella sp.]
MKLEVCANSYQSAKNAQSAQAQRIELCQELSVGGITPSYGLLKQVIKDLEIEIFVLIRPRSGDFVYTDNEFQIIKNDIKICKDLGCQGIVLGVLNHNKTIDLKRTQELVELSKPLPFTFHRAFDEVLKPKEALEQLIDLGVDRVLTSGQKSSAEEGLSLLKELNKIANGRITILAGGGVNADNASKFKTAGLQEVHASASVKIEQENSIFGMTQSVSDINKIKAILDAISK